MLGIGNLGYEGRSEYNPEWDTWEIEKFKTTYYGCLYYLEDKLVV